jgi:tetratricopeptide (TPR) repeat protein
MNVITQIHSKAILMVAAALFMAGLSAIFSPLAAQQIAPASATDAAPVAPQYTDREINTMHQRVAADATDYVALTRLGAAYLQKARETNDPAFYGAAQDALDKALAASPGDYDALTALGSLQLSRHDFAGALETGRKAQRAIPDRAAAYGVVADALTELGRYDEAVEAVQRMVDLRPDLSSYSRVSYARELHGDVEGAIEAMQKAVNAGSPAAENTAWCRVQLGNLYFNSGGLDKAEAEYSQALTSYPGYLHALAGLGQVRWAQGNTAEAIDLYKRAVSSVPLPQYLTALGDLYTANGEADKAREQYDLVAYIFKVFEANGVNVGVEKAAFLADRDEDTAEAVRLAEREAQTRQDVHTLDTLAWAYYRAERYNDALAAEQHALRLGTQNPLFYYHLGMIQNSLGNKSEARANVQKALDLNPHFSIRYAGEAAAFVKEQAP